MERPPSYYAKPKIEDDSPQPDCLTALLHRKGPVSIDMIAEAWVRDLPTAIKQSLVEFFVEGPLDQVWRYDLLHIENFPSGEARTAYLSDLMLTYSTEPEERQHQQVLAHLRRDVVQYLISIVRQRILDALFRDANRNRGSGFAGALERLESGSSLEQRKAVLAMLKAFGVDFLADPSFPIIRQRYLEHTRTNRTFQQECDTTLTTRSRKPGHAGARHRQHELIWLALRPDVTRTHLNGTWTATELKHVLRKAGVKTEIHESSKTFHQFVVRNFIDLKDKTPS